MELQTWTYLIVGLTFALYIGIAIWSRVQTTEGFYVAGGDVSPLANGMATEDSDKDGMPNNWGPGNGLGPFNDSDLNNTYGPGYTMLEKYLNSIYSF